MTILVTGAAEFIGFDVAKILLATVEQVVGIDNLNDYYDVLLAKARLAQLNDADFTFDRIYKPVREAVFDLIDRSSSSEVVHLAATVGLQYSVKDPYAYVQSDVMGCVIMFEAARRMTGRLHFIYVRLSLVYSSNRDLPFEGRTASINIPRSTRRQSGSTHSSATPTLTFMNCRRRVFGFSLSTFLSVGST